MVDLNGNRVRYDSADLQIARTFARNITSNIVELRKRLADAPDPAELSKRLAAGTYMLGKMLDFEQVVVTAECYTLMSDINRVTALSISILETYLNKHKDDDKIDRDVLTQIDRQMLRFLDLAKVISSLREKGFIAQRQSGNIVNIVGGNASTEGNPDLDFVSALRQLGAIGPLHDKGQKNPQARPVENERRPEEGSGGDDAPGGERTEGQDSGAEEP